MPAITETLKSSNTSYVVPNGKRAVVKILAFRLVGELNLNGDLVLSSGSSGFVDAEFTMVMIAGTTLEIEDTSGGRDVRGVVVINGFLEDDT